MTSKRKTSAAISQFSGDIRGFAQQIGDSLNLLKRTIDYGPSSGLHEFKDALSEVEEEVAEISLELEQLEQHTAQAISFEELLGHCLGLYHSNRQGVVQLEQHLRQYGYVPPNDLQQPVDPISMRHPQSQGQTDAADSDSEDDDVLLAGSAEADQDLLSHTLRTGGKGVRVVSHIAPHTPHYAMSQEAKARLQQRVKTPGLPLHFHHSDDEDDDDDDEDVQVFRGAGRPADDTMRQLDVARLPSGNSPSTTRQPLASTTPAATAALQPAGTGRTWRQPPSPSLSASLTPEGLLLSPSFAALQAKYGSDAQPAAQSEAPAQTLPSPPLPPDQRLDFERLSLSGDEVLLGDGTPVAALPPPRSLLPPQVQVQAEEDTCCLYQLLIRSKEVPASLVTASERAAASRNTGSLAQPAPHLPSAAATRRSQSVSTLACTPTRQAAPLGVCGPTPSPARYSRSRSALRGAEADAARASAAKALEGQLASLEQQWVASGQAALTPRRAAARQAAGAGGGQAPAASPSLAKFHDLPAAAVAHKQAAGTFEFDLHKPTNQAATTSKRSLFPADVPTQARCPPSLAPAATTTSLTATTATPLLDSHLLALRLTSSSAATTTSSDLLASFTPSLQTLSGATQLSPGTASLLTRVFGAGGIPTTTSVHAQQDTTTTRTQAALQPRHTAPPSAEHPPAPAPPAAATSSTTTTTSAPSARAAPRLVSSQEFASLPLFLSSQLSLTQLNTALLHVSQLPGAYTPQGFSLDALDQLGLNAQATKALHSSLVKLQRAVMLAGSRLQLCGGLSH